VDSPPAGDDWLHEIKHDGFRLLCRIEDGQAHLSSRGGYDWTKRLWPIARAARALPLKNAVLDGELVALRPDGASNFIDLLTALRTGQVGQLVYYVFDLLHRDGHDLRRVACQDRKDALAEVLRRAQAPICYVDYIQGHGPEFFEACHERGLEGIVSKRCKSRYTGRRTNDWLKTKCLRLGEFVVGGFVPQGRTGVGSLLVGQFDEQSRLLYVGSVSAGVRAVPRDLPAVLQALAQESRSFVRQRGQKIDRASRWVEPRLIASVKYLDWTEDGMLRQPVLQAVRPRQ
jgi:bifunctional non-homologous end joining protein LigD